MAAQTPRVLVLVDTDIGWGRGLIRGIARYIHETAPWSTWIPRQTQGEMGRAPFGWKGEGVIARVHSQAMARHLRRLGAPVVNVSGIEFQGVDFPRVTADVEAAGKLAAAHFLDRGFRHFAYCGWLQSSHVRRHCQGLTDAVARAGCECSTFAMGLGPTSRRHFHDQFNQLARWLKSLPKPLAVLAWATQGLAVLDACALAGLHVPEEVAVLSGDDDDLLYGIHDPPLSGIALPVEQIGYEAAAMLNRLMRGRRASPKPVYLKPTRVITRQSTDVMAVSDSDVAAALRFIREHAAEPIGVDDILQAVPISRRAMERKFIETIGRAPAQEIRRVRMERAAQLLCETKLSIDAVARAAGFRSPVYMTYVFRKERKTTPLKYRQARGSSPD